MASNMLKFTHENRDIEYKFRPPKRDKRSLLVIFSGGFVGGIDFAGNSTSLIDAAVLWIRDEENSYYMQRGNDAWYDRATKAIIEHYVHLLGASVEDVVLLGASKGGTAALYHGLTSPYPNIIAAAPRIHPAQGNLEKRPEVVQNLVGSLDADAINSFDQTIPKLLKSGDHKKNIYIFTSKADEQYYSEILPNLDLFNEQSNFNLIETDSPSVNQHEDVTVYNLSGIMSITGLLTDGIVPKIGSTKNGLRARKSLNAIGPSLLHGTPVNSVDIVQIRKDGLWITGQTFIRGIDASDYSSVRRFLHFTQQRSVSKSYLGGLKDRRSNRDYFDSVAVDYSVGGYAPQGNKSISLDNLAFGTYKLEMEVRSGELVRRTSEFDVRPVQSVMAISDYVVKLEAKGKEIKLSKMPIQMKVNVEGQFTLEEYWLSNSKLHIAGRFSLNNVDSELWSDVNYSLIFLDEEKRHAVHNMQLAKHSREVLNIPWRNTSKANYTTPRHAGVTLPSLTSGRYRLALLGNFNGFIQTVDTELTLIVEESPDVIRIEKS